MSLEEIINSEDKMYQKMDKIIKSPRFANCLKFQTKWLFNFLLQDGPLEYMLLTYFSGNFENSNIDENITQLVYKVFLNRRVFLYVIDNPYLLRKLFKVDFGKANYIRINSWIQLVKEYLYQEPMKVFNFFILNYKLIEKTIQLNIKISLCENLFLLFMFCEPARKKNEMEIMHRNLEIMLNSTPKEKRDQIKYKFAEENFAGKLLLQFKLSKEEEEMGQIVNILSEIVFRSMEKKQIHPICANLLSQKNLELLVTIPTKKWQYLKLLKAIIRGLVKFNFVNRLYFVISIKMVDFESIYGSKNGKYVGENRVMVFDFLADVVRHINLKEINEKLARGGFFLNFTDYVFSYPQNNILHYSFEKLLKFVYSDDGEKKKEGSNGGKKDKKKNPKVIEENEKREFQKKLLRIIILVKCELVQRILKELDRNKILKEKEGRESCLMGHLISFSNLICNNEESVKYIDTFNDEYKKKWNNWISNELNTRNEKIQFVLGGRHPITKNLEYAEETDDESEEDEDAWQFGIANDEDRKGLFSDSDSESDDDEEKKNFDIQRVQKSLEEMRRITYSDSSDTESSDSDEENLGDEARKKEKKEKYKIMGKVLLKDLFEKKDLQNNVLISEIIEIGKEENNEEKKSLVLEKEKKRENEKLEEGKKNEYEKKLKIQQEEKISENENLEEKKEKN